MQKLKCKTIYRTDEKDFDSILNDWLDSIGEKNIKSIEFETCFNIPNPSPLTYSYSSPHFIVHILYYKS
jgi:hypothetical protein